MPSPPLTTDDGPIDFEHLSRMTLGDAGLEQEVLAMFVAESSTLVLTLAAMPADSSALAHTLKGSRARVGAFCRRRCRRPAETAMARLPISSAALAELGETVAEARAAIEAVLRRS